WIAYNKRLLDFFLENKERCVLINFEAFQSNKKNIIKPLSNIIKIDNLMSAHYKNSILFDVVENNDYTKSNEIALLEKYTTLFSLSANETEITFNDTKVSEYLVSELIKERTEVLKLYNELQAYANLPYIETSKDNVSAEAALWEVVEERNSIFNIVSHLVQESKKKDADIELTKSIFKKRQFLLLNRINELKKEKEEVIKLSKINHNDVVRQEKYPDDIEKKINDIQKYEEEISEKESKLTQAISEKEQILKQLHIVQEQLEHYFIENQEIKKKLPPVLYGAAEQIKQELGYRLGYIIVSYSKSLKGIITMPFALIRECVFEKKRKKSYGVDVPLYLYADADKAERVKKHLSYQLGQAIISSANSIFGFITLPFKLIVLVYKYRRAKIKGC
ncbi:TPA: kfiB protein, partial [Escherichia coli]|nr:kfiB protein [Escherichia coli]HCM9843989.1 kfiB protein [Escherichia coli]HCN2662455.1 kfiB protein [Escherichia coli]